jgi:hypothetical protein
MDSSTVPSPRRVRHYASLLWWLLVVVIVFAVQHVQRTYLHASLPSMPQAPGTEHEAFVALAFGKVSDTDPQAIQPQVLRAQLERLKASGAHVVRLADVRAFLEWQQPLPDRPVLLVFDEARRETVEAVDPILAELQLPAAALVNVDAVEQGNLDLVSRRQLRRMVESGRWEAGISACQEQAAAATADYARQRSVLRRRTGGAVLAIGCLRRPWHDDEAPSWNAALQDAALPLGFVARAPGANYRDRPASTLGLIRMSAEQLDADALVRQVAAYAPRRQRYVDDFDGASLAADWIANPGHARVDGGAMRLAVGAGDTDGSVTLGGTQRWQDMHVAVDLAAPPPGGQFWMYVRRNGAGSFLRLGIVDQRVVLQKSDAAGQTRQLVVREVGRRPLRLALQVSGLRALAYIDDDPLLDRPTDLPADLTEGPVVLAVWNAEGDASAVVQRVEAAPLERRIALISPQPSETTFAKLRENADELWAVSPRLFGWRAGAARTLGTSDRALEIFVYHHHLALHPAVAIDALPPAAEWERFSAQMLRWAASPQFGGLNLVVDRIAKDDAAKIEGLRRTLAASGKKLTVTLGSTTLDSSDSPDYAWFARARAGSQSFQVASVPLRLVPG